MENKIEYIIKISGCARCGNVHEHLEVFSLNNPPDDYEYFSTCPETQQPILVKKIVEEETR